MGGKNFQKLRLLFAVAAVLISIVLLVGRGQGGVMAEFQPPAEPVSGGWTAECIDCLRYFSAMSGNSAALDSNGLIHTAYGGDSLYYAAQNPDNSYTAEVVDPNPQRGLNAAMVLDSGDRPHILYYAGDLLRLNYAYFDGANWQITSLPTADLTALPHPWLVVDSSDNLHLAFIEGASLVYGFYDLINWSFMTVDTDTGGNIGRPSLDLDSSERAHIAYSRGGKYAYFDGVDWQITTFPGTYDDGESIAFALDQNDHPHIVYQTDFIPDGYLDLRYRYDVGSGWQEETIDNGIFPYVIHNGYDISLILDAANQPIAGYSAQFLSDTPYPWYEYYALRVSRRDQNGWQHEDINILTGPLYDTQYNTLISGPGDDLTLVYKDARNLMSAVLDGNDVTTSVIDRGGISGTYSDMVVDSEDRLHFSAHELEGDGIRYGVRDGGGWSVEYPPGSSGFVGSNWTSLALSTDARPYIVFDHYIRLDGMPYVYFDGQGWIYDQAQYGNYSFEAAMDLDDNFHVAFFSYGTWSLYHYSRSPAGVWSTPVLLDPDNGYGQLDIALDSAGFPHIAYPATDGLRYAVETPTGWLTETVAGGSVDYPSLALDRDGRPHIAWYDTAVGNLRYAVFDGGSWQVRTIDSAGDVGMYPSLAVDRLGRVYISYYKADNGNLKYASFDGSSWTTETLLSDGDVGAFSKLVMPYAGYPAIAYYDATARDMMLIYRPFAPNHENYSPLFVK